MVRKKKRYIICALFEKFYAHWINLNPWIKGELTIDYTHPRTICFLFFSSIIYINNNVLTVAKYNGGREGVWFYIKGKIGIIIIVPVAGASAII